jgi:hypothetical protein
MKTIAFSLFFLFSTILFSQIHHINSQLRHFFSGLTVPQQHSDFFYDLTVHTVDSNNPSRYFDHLANDTNNVSLWLDIYNEVYYMAHDTMSLLTLDSIAIKAIDTNEFDTTYPSGHYHPKKVPIALAHINYHRLNQAALDPADISGFFEVDTFDNVIYDILDEDDPNIPYIKDTLFTASSLDILYSGKEYRFVLDQEWFILDNTTQQYYNTNAPYEFVVDFDDGNGSQYFDTWKRHEIDIDYQSDGLKIVKIEVQNKITGDVIAGTYFRIRIPPFVVYPDPDNTASGPGYDVAIYGGCSSGANVDVRKIAVIVGGYDPANSIPAAGLWQLVGEDTRISILQDYGYEFHVVDFTNTTQDMRTNAMVLIDYLDQLKCELLGSTGNPEDPPRYGQPMVVVGYSMGGVIANYALAYWEQNPQISDCFEDYLHYTRLLITMDSPHEGANIPLAYQHFYRDLPGLYEGKIISMYAKKVSEGALKGLLDSKAARQLLMYHVDTRFGGYYNSHPERQAFLNDLNDLGGGPAHCKVMAVSNGSAQGVRQKRSWDTSVRTPGDRLLTMDATIYGKLLWMKIKIKELDLELRTTGGSGPIYKYEILDRYFKVKFTWRKGLTCKYVSSRKKISGLHAYVNGYDVAAGGNFVAFTISDIQNTINSLDPPNYKWGLFERNKSFAMNFYDLGGGNYKIKGHSDVFNIGATGVANFGTDGFDFNFIPMRSSLSFGGSLYSGDPSPNIQNMNAGTVTGQTPFDVVMALSDENRTDDMIADNAWNMEHTSLFNPPLRDRSQPPPADVIRYRTCGLVTGADEISFILNREFGDETIYLENLEQVFPEAVYYTEYDIYVNERNPGYQYPSFNDFNHRDLATFSKDEPYTQVPCSTWFISDQTAATSFPPPDQSPGYVYNSPVTGISRYTDTAMFICCNNQLRLRSPQKTKANLQTDYLGKEQGYHMVRLTGATVGIIEFRLFDMNGRLLREGRWGASEAGIYQLASPEVSGIYVLQTISGGKASTLKIVNP